LSILSILYLFVIFLFVCHFRWARLKSLLEEIDVEAKELNRETRHVCYKSYIGDNFFVSLNTGVRCVDFRKFYLPYGLEVGNEKPTRTGLALNLEEWNDFLASIPLVEMKYRRLAMAVSSTMQDVSQYTPFGARTY